MSTCQVFEDDGGVLLDTPYIAEFVDELKAGIPARRRRWSKTLKMWRVDAAWVDEAISIAQQYYRVEFANRGTEREAKRNPEPAAWAELWLVPGAPPEVIRAAYRVMAQLHHPDRGGDTAAMQRINAAYELIGDGQ